MIQLAAFIVHVQKDTHLMMTNQRVKVSSLPVFPTWPYLSLISLFGVGTLVFC